MRRNQENEELTSIQKKKKPAYDRKLLEHNQNGHSPESGSGHGGTEMGWLVSYADMMTLLFGLFVLLYVMASEKNGNIEKNLKEVSEKYFSETKTDQNQKIVSKSSIDISPDQKDLVKQLQAKINQMKSEMQKLKEIPDQRQTVAELEQKVIELQFKIAELQQQQNPDQKDLVKQLQAKINQMKSEMQKLKEIPDQRQTVAELEQKVAELKEKANQLKKENSELHQREPASIQKKFMMISALWTTEKHDVDLYITDPNGFVYNFKNTRGPDSLGTFEVDSRFGPGLELWKTENLKPGKYQVDVKLYRQYENTKDAEVKVHIVTNKVSLYLPVAVLNLKNKEKKYIINVDQKGTINVL